jgi:NAD(P)-dependent dehydrogenase (short-subunit alcohol dehydrogenase family)
VTSTGDLHADLDGRVAIVTGAAQGIGESIATFLATAGASVLLADIQEDRVVDAARRLRAAGHRAAPCRVDVRDPRSASAMVASCLDEFGKVDVLINNAGIDAPPGAAWEIDEEHWCSLIDTNLSGAWWCTQAALGPMMRQRSGRIVFISSGSARIGDQGISVAYNASKAGLIGLTIALSVHLEPFGILVNAIAPGYTGTGEPMSGEERSAYDAAHPLGIVGPEPIARACLYLASAGGDWITGAVLNVSGGWWRGW